MPQQPDSISNSASIAEDAYLAARQKPQPGGPYYLHLADVLNAITKLRPLECRRVLDFGAGGSPYRCLFPSSEYCRADLPGDANLDYQIQSDGTTNAPEANFDCVLSTQVLEHVARPDVYLRECFRVLRPGGTLLLSTHGFFEEHGSPRDYYRWTPDGITYIINSAGFHTQKVYKLTSGGRAAAALLPQILWRLADHKHPVGWVFAVANKALYLLRGPFEKWVDRMFPEDALVSPEKSGHVIYTGIIATAIKPELS